MTRTDLSPNLIHFTRASGEMEALDVLLKILKERKILGGNKLIKGKTNCISFTEAPLNSLEAGLYAVKGCERYSLYGIQFSKNDIFRLGGRPVFYGPGEEFALLPKALRWRHVRFDISCEHPIDFTWEREWRLKTHQLDLCWDKVTVVVPDAAAAASFRSRVNESFYDAWEWTQVLGDAACAYDDSIPWKTIQLKSKSPSPCGMR